MRWADSGRVSDWQAGGWQPDQRGGDAGAPSPAGAAAYASAPVYAGPDTVAGTEALAGTEAFAGTNAFAGTDADAFAGTNAFADAGAFAGTNAFADAGAFAGTAAPTRPDPIMPARREGAEPAYGRDLDESDELFRAWQGSVRRAAGGPRRRLVWQILRVGVPAAVLVTVGAGAVMMLTGRTGEMLDSRASHGSASHGSQGSASQRSTAPRAAGTFAGYPGQRGTVTVSAIAAAGGTRLAVGSADGHPAIWQRAAGGIWSLISASSPALYQRPGAENLTSVAHGPAGWIAVGGVVSGATERPVVVTSADGVRWHPVDAAALTAPGVFATAVTAGPHGYVIVGKHVGDGRTIAAMWWSADLRNWASGSNGGLDGRLKPSSVWAVGATAIGFVAAGTHGGCHTIWTSADGQSWSPYDVPRPPGTNNALLSQVAVDGARVVTAGYVTGKAGNMPVVVASTDGGRHWRQILLPAPAGLGSVTALTAAGDGFVAAGQAGPAGAQHAVTWSSPDGLTWSAATPAGAGQITALSASGGTVFGTAQRSAGPSVVTLAAP